jgi:hypothetical protein
VTLHVSRLTIFRSDGQRPCSSCGRPRDRKGQRTCTECHTNYMRRWRAGEVGGGKIDARLTPEELAGVLQARAAREAAAAEPAPAPGRHRR